MTTSERTQRRNPRCRTHTTPTSSRHRPRTTAPPTSNRRAGGCVSRTSNEPPTPPDTVPAGVEWLTTNQAAAYVQVPARQLQQWRYLKKGPPYSLAGRAVRYRLADLDAWLLAHRIEPTSTR